jgi:light-regulated signal transduction histidine kinase (bacteriophytochrome)
MGLPNVEIEERMSRCTAQLEAANEELAAFSYSVSHDLRSPLRAISGFSRALQEESEGALNEAGRNYLLRIINATRRMSEMIDALLTLAKVSGGQLLDESIDLTEVVRSVLAELQEQDPQRQVEIEVAQEVVAQGDPTLLRLALRKLLENAWKFTVQRPLARIEFGVISDQGADTFFVRDNGIGFDPAFTGRLFAAFQRLHSAEECAGIGVGLVIAKRIIHRHGGRIWANAAQDGGATFHFSLSVPKLS